MFSNALDSIVFGLLLHCFFELVFQDARDNNLIRVHSLHDFYFLAPIQLITPKNVNAHAPKYCIHFDLKIYHSRAHKYDIDATS